MVNSGGKDNGGRDATRNSSAEAPPWLKLRASDVSALQAGSDRAALHSKIATRVGGKRGVGNKRGRNIGK